MKVLVGTKVMQELRHGGVCCSCASGVAVRGTHVHLGLGVLFGYFFWREKRMALP